MKIRELYSDESKWCKYSSARDVNGDYTHPNDDNAVKWCLLGAVVKCYDPDYVNTAVSGKISKLLREATEEKFPSYVSFNDHIDTKFEDVKALVDKLDI